MKEYQIHPDRAIELTFLHSNLDATVGPFGCTPEYSFLAPKCLLLFVIKLYGTLIRFGELVLDISVVVVNFIACALASGGKLSVVWAESIEIPEELGCDLVAYFVEV